MNFHKRLGKMVSTDDLIHDLPQLEIYSSSRDYNHFCRRLQQRAISWDMIKLTIAYGRFKYHSQAQTWTLLDRSLAHTPYSRFMDKLRGLRIIANISSTDSTLTLSTAYWAYNLRR